MVRSFKKHYEACLNVGMLDISGKHGSTCVFMMMGTMVDMLCVSPYTRKDAFNMGDRPRAGFGGGGAKIEHDYEDFYR